VAGSNPISEIAEVETEVDGIPIRYLKAGDRSDVLYLHGVPNSADEWRPFLELGGGIAVDLPGFGRSGKRADWDYSIEGYDRFVERFLDQLGLERCRLVMHDWGGVGLAFAQRCPQRVQRMVLIDVVPFLPGYRWHRVARIWRTRVLGELFMGTTNRLTVRMTRRFSGLHPGVDEDMLAHFDQGTQRAILRLYRSAPEDVLAAAGARLGEVTAPTLVVWGDRDPFLPRHFADDYAAALPNATVEHVAGAGHWVWLDEHTSIQRICNWIGR
jgi:pimeloyl-ACP methyl ester carboxylesterase